MLPFVQTVDEGIKIYQSFSGSERVEKMGCCAIGVNFISGKLNFKNYGD
jgi:ASC-1-like (ASCH) protein